MTTHMSSSSERPQVRRSRSRSPGLRHRWSDTSKNACLMGYLCRTFREVKKAPASLYRGFKCVSLERSKGFAPRPALISIPKHKSANGCPKKTGPCPKNDIHAGRPCWRLTDRPFVQKLLVES